MIKVGASLLVAAMFFAGSVSTLPADTIYGKCVYPDGSKANGSVTISTSWNSKKAYPANGRYVLDFGKKLGRSITVYVNGSTFGRVYVSGSTRLDIVVP